MKDCRLVSVIIPVYNVEAYIEECLQSLINQTYSNFECVVIDDGSTDSSASVIERITHDDNRFTVIHTINKGVSAARNTGLDLVKGDYVVFLDSDDFYNEHFIEVMVSAISSGDYDFVSCCANFVDENGIFIKQNHYTKERLEINTNEDVLETYMTSNYIEDAAWNKIYQKSLFDNLRYTEGIIFEDTEIIVRILKRCTKVLFIREALYNYRIRKGSIMDYAETVDSFQTKFNPKKMDSLRVYEKSAEELHGTKWELTYKKRILLSCCELAKLRKYVNKRDHHQYKHVLYYYYKKYHRYLYTKGLFSLKQILYIELWMMLARVK